MEFGVGGVICVTVYSVDESVVVRRTTVVLPGSTSLLLARWKVVRMDHVHGVLGGSVTIYVLCGAGFRR